MFESIAPAGGMIATAVETIKTYWALGATVLLVITYLNPSGIGDKMLTTVRGWVKPGEANNARIIALETKVAENALAFNTKLDAILEKLAK